MNDEDAAVAQMRADHERGLQWEQAQKVTAILDEVKAERLRQIGSEGWSAAHDDEHTDESLAIIAALYALPPHLRDERRTQRTEVEDIAQRGEGPVWGKVRRFYRVPALWARSWHPSWWKPKARRRDLIRALALLVAEIERRDRAKPCHSQGGEK